jgi:hypothetical protein
LQQIWPAQSLWSSQKYESPMHVLPVERHVPPPVALLQQNSCGNWHGLTALPDTQFTFWEVSVQRP